MYSYLTTQLAEQRCREVLAEQRQAQAAARAASSWRARRARSRRVRLAVRKVLWLRSDLQR
ncbi:MAG TPA: hypothetical protein VFJ07_07080 [Streptosporangiaceae bacterium]|nr:hypothetical protein [Streptosporangiaceae bacterium]